VAYNNTAALQVFDLDESLHFGKLEDSDFLYFLCRPRGSIYGPRG
jgi:hypothetical protein